jgi:hypothetical protein
MNRLALPRRNVSGDVFGLHDAGEEARVVRRWGESKVFQNFSEHVVPVVWGAAETIKGLFQ